MSRYRPAHRPGTEYDLYCVERIEPAGPGDPWVVLGVMSCPSADREALLKDIVRVKGDHKHDEPLRLADVTEGDRGCYASLLALFLDDPQLQFRAVLADRAAFIAQQGRAQNPKDHAEPTLPNLYYLLLAHWLGAGCTYELYWPFGFARPKEWFEALKALLDERLTGRAQLPVLAPIKQTHRDLLGFTGLLVDLVTMSWNAIPMTPDQEALASVLAEGLGRESLLSPAPEDDLRFRVYVLRPPERDHEPEKGAH